VDTGFAVSEYLTFNLTQQDLSNAGMVADAITRKIGVSAQAIDGASIRINAPMGGEARVRLMSQIENLEIRPTQPPARVIVNARTGTVVINGAVRVGPAAVSHGKLTVRVDEQPTVVQPSPFSRGETAVEQSSDISVEESRNPMFMMNPGASLSDIVKAINRIGASPGDFVAILEALSQAGALSAELVII
jgi:flagellar P-ring protein FlgI